MQMHIQVSTRALAQHLTEPALYNYIRYVEDRQQTSGQTEEGNSYACDYLPANADEVSETLCFLHTICTGRF
jgi:hypothetical protein